MQLLLLKFYWLPFSTFLCPFGKTNIYAFLYVADEQMAWNSFAFHLIALHYQELYRTIQNIMNISALINFINIYRNDKWQLLLLHLRQSAFVKQQVFIHEWFLTFLQFIKPFCTTSYEQFHSFCKFISKNF